MTTKKQALEALLEERAKTPFKTHYYTDILAEGLTVEDFEGLIEAGGKFSDLEDGIDAIMPAMKRLANIAVKYHWHSGKAWEDLAFKERFLRATARYSKMEADRTEPKEGRFHNSIFRIPGNAINIFYALLPDMMSVERGEADATLSAAYEEICRVAMQPWTLPKRFDETDDNPISVERFQNHMWWITANGIGYRPLIYSAIMFRSEKMMDVLAEVVARSLSPLSYNTQGYAFWSEGICADGFGWGHGRQAYNLGYPLHGLRAIFEILTIMKGTPWEYALDEVNVELIITFIRAITFCEYKESGTPMQGRSIFYRHPRALDPEYVKNVRSSQNGEAVAVARAVLSLFAHRISLEERAELEALCECRSSLKMTDFTDKYRGVRYFWNNDSLIKKTDKSYIYINMASSRRDGTEFAHHMADKRNYFIADGSYVLMKAGGEYRDAMGTWQMSDMPGVTARKLKNSELKTEVNWHGYRSKYNFAAGASSADAGCAGFIFEKDDIREPDGAGTIYDDYSKEIMGVEAYKSYFITGDTVTCLGTGITDLRPELGREIHTTVNNTLRSTEAAVLTADGNARECVEGVREYTVDSASLYVKQGGILYAVLPSENQRVRVECEKRRTNWSDLHFGNKPSQDSEVEIFELAIYHGEAPKNSSYAYHMYCGDADVKDYISESVPRVLSNTKEVQAVSSADGRILQAIFFDADALLMCGECALKLSSPGALMIEYDGENDTSYITVSDGKQDPVLNNMSLSVRRAGGEWQNISIALPTAEYCGKPVTVEYRGKLI
ncbi:MAG: hypothetical protein IJY65_01290 [Clostridia bacterium]|nr:hypothetical protein [Clostridia bacterium]